MRIFVGISIASGIREKVVEIQEQLKLAGADVRWVAKDNLHLTLHFCGEVGDKKAQEVIQVCRGIASEVAPFTLEIKYVGSFPPYGDPRIIWTGVEKGRDEAITLIDVTKRHLTMVTGVTEKKDISPHLTFGRIRSTRNIGVLTTQLHKFANIGFGEQLVDKILVMESKLTPSGPVYSILEEIKLGN